MSVIEFPSIPNYTGKSVTVSPENPLNRFQCRGFVCFRNAPQVVPPNADMGAIQTALLDGRLLEMSPGSVLSSKNASLNPASELGETDKKIFTLLTKEGRIVLTPDTAEQAEAIEKELRETGQIQLSNYPNLQKKKAVVTHLTGITVTELEEPKNEQPDSN
jgi:hypothetical protein